ncbi:hypothetical protein OTU49_013227, partial [Cherax quadricarinatus]
LRKVWPLLQQPRFFIFCCFVVLNGAFDGIVASYIFLMQEDMARTTDAMAHIKFIQGMTLFIQCFFEVPFMFLSDWFTKQMGANYVTSLVFILYFFRLLGLSIVGAHGPVWATLLVELLNGPCFGLGYTAIVAHSASVSPPGTSTIVQSLVNICYDSVGYAMASLMGGLLFSSLGGPGMYLVAGISAMVTFLLHLLSIRLLPPAQDSTLKVALRDEGETMALNEAISARNKDDVKMGLNKAVSARNEDDVKMVLNETISPRNKDDVKMALNETISARNEDNVQVVLNKAISARNEDDVKMVLNETISPRNKDDVKMVLNETISARNEDDGKMVLNKTISARNEDDVKMTLNETISARNEDDVKMALNKDSLAG